MLALLATRGGQDDYLRRDTATWRLHVGVAGSWHFSRIIGSATTETSRSRSLARLRATRGVAYTMVAVLDMAHGVTHVLLKYTSLGWGRRRRMV